MFWYKKINSLHDFLRNKKIMLQKDIIGVQFFFLRNCFLDFPGLGVGQSCVATTGLWEVVKSEFHHKVSKLDSHGEALGFLQPFISFLTYLYLCLFLLMKFFFILDPNKLFKLIWWWTNHWKCNIFDQTDLIFSSSELDFLMWNGTTFDDLS